MSEITTTLANDKDRGVEDYLDQIRLKFGRLIKTPCTAQVLPETTGRC
ncbi:hypothetical protein O9993_16675 [Vibrio lentus]|nr:hypothetical protein [Vibrio lentus]